MDSETAAKIVRQSSEPYSLFVYDVPTSATYLYSVIRRVIRKRALFLNLSCYLIKTAQRNEIVQCLEKEMEKTEQKHIKNGLSFQPVTYYILPFDPIANEQIIQISKTNLNTQIREIGQSLLDRIDRLRKKVEEEKLSKDEFSAKYALAIKKAQKDVEEAQGLALLFLLEKDVVPAIALTVKMINEQEALQDEKVVPEKTGT